MSHDSLHEGKMAGPNEYADRHPQKLCILAHRNLVFADSAENKLTKKRSFFSLHALGLVRLSPPGTGMCAKSPFSGHADHATSAGAPGKQQHGDTIFLANCFHILADTFSVQAKFAPDIIFREKKGSADGSCPTFLFLVGHVGRPDKHEIYQLLHESRAHALGMHVLVEHYIGTPIDRSVQTGKLPVSIMQIDKNSFVFQ